MYAQVALPVSPRRLFTYEIPPDWKGSIEPGQRVVVPFGRRSLPGTVVALQDSAPQGVRVRRLGGPTAELPRLPREILDLTRWAADYYLVSWGAILEAAAPSLLHVRRRHSLWPGPVSSERRGLEGEILLAVRSRPGLRPETLRRRFRDADLKGTLARLERKGLIVRREEWAVPQHRATPRKPDEAALQGVSTATDHAPAPFTLTQEQRAAVERIDSAVDAARFEAFLLKGVTGSGKTEVYLQGVRRALSLGRRALYLVPEIGLTPILAGRLQREFGDGLAVLHSGMGSRERAQAWKSVMDGSARLVLGARSAVFAPVPQLGLIVVDEEHDTSFKQDDFPRYNGRDLAVVRARLAGVPIVLGSATPSLETVHRARAGKMQLLELKQRIDGRPLPEVQIVDMRLELGQGSGRGPVLSSTLIESLREAVSSGGQAILLLNRRGYASFIVCRACGEVVRCRHCSVGLSLHRQEARMRCHYCGRVEPVAERCPSCGGEDLAQGTEGTERLEEELKRALPGVRAVRLDSDTARGRGRVVAQALRAFEKGEAQVLLGTQMVAKGHDFPNVILVGVLCADQALGFPDFRAAERTYQLIHQVSGRAGRGTRPGRVIVQSFAPEHYAVRLGASQDYDAFFEKELAYRKGLRYPPFTVLVQLILSDRQTQRGFTRARQVSERVKKAGGGDLRVLGPALAPLSKLRGQFRFQILIKGTNRRRLNRVLADVLEKLETERFPLHALTVDVDPVTTL